MQRCPLVRIANFQSLGVVFYGNFRHLAIPAWILAQVVDPSRSCAVRDGHTTREPLQHSLQCVLVDGRIAAKEGNWECAVLGFDTFGDAAEDLH